MKIIPGNVRKFQEGGPVGPEAAPVEGAPEGAPQGGGEQDPLMQLAQLFAQGLQNQDCNMLAQGAQMFLQLMQAQAQGGAAPEPQGEPVYRKGGVLVRRIKK